MADPWTAALEEAEASVPADIVVYPTLELRHPAFVELGEPVAIRIVSGPAENMDFGIEDGAAMNGGETVTFIALPFFAERPEFAEGRMPECQITVDNVNRELVPRLQEAVKIRADLIVEYREYRSDDLTAPCYGPVAFNMRKVKMTGTSLTGVAKLDDLANRKFPKRVYRPHEYPGLLSS